MWGALHGSAGLDMHCAFWGGVGRRATHGILGVGTPKGKLGSDHNRSYKALGHFHMAFRESLRGVGFCFASVRFINSYIPLIKFRNK